MRLVLTPLILTASVLLAGCTGSKEQAASSNTPVATQAGAPVGPAVVTVHAKDFAFDAPAQISGGLTTFKLVNDGQTFHHMVIVRLDSGKTVADFQEAMKKQGPPPAWAVFIGGPNAPDPTKESNATLDLRAGNYVLLCLVDGPDGVPHFAKGMVHPLTVGPATGVAATAPTADITIGLKEYGFDLSKPITAGAHTFEVRNAGAQQHEVELIKLAPGKKVEDLLKWMQKPDGPPPGSGVGGAVVGLTGAPVYFTADFTAGDFVFICFIPDAKDQKPHFAHGMVHSFTVN